MAPLVPAREEFKRDHLTGHMIAPSVFLDWTAAGGVRAEFQYERHGLCRCLIVPQSLLKSRARLSGMPGLSAANAALERTVRARHDLG